MKNTQEDLDFGFKTVSMDYSHYGTKIDWFVFTLDADRQILKTDSGYVVQNRVGIDRSNTDSWEPTEDRLFCLSDVRGFVARA